MPILAVMNRDLLCFALMLIAIIAGIHGTLRALLLSVKVGLLICAIIFCLGVAYFGWGPLFGGQQPAETLFGSTMLFLSLVGAGILFAIDEGVRRIIGVSDERRGSPVMPRRPE